MSSFLLAASAAFPMLLEGYTIDLNALGHFVRVIVEGVGIVGVGVIVFTLILKAITTPFDIYQRVNMRKQTLIMRNMQPELEKLQKQYANDKQTYNMKMLELQKKNGYSMLGACLPMIISLVILIIAVAAFQSYAQYANLSMYRGMAESYNRAVKTYAVEGGEWIDGIPESGTESFTLDYQFAKEGLPEGTPVIDWDFEAGGPRTEGNITYLGESHVIGNVSYTVYKYANSEMRYMEVVSTDTASGKEGIYLYYTYELDSGNLTRSYQVDLNKFYYEQENASFKAEIKTFIDGYLKNAEEGVTLTEADACVAWFQNEGAKAAAENFREMNNPGFLWVKNVWYPDVSYQHPIQDYKAFTNSITSDIVLRSGEKVKIGRIFSQAEYESLTSLLEEEKGQANGYFILIVLTIGLMVLSQFITMKSQKESSQYQTVDGQGARTQKVMMIMMPLIYAITGFLWTAAFSIYIAVSSIISIIVTLLANLIIGRIFKKKEEEQLKQRYTRSVPWKQDEKKKK